MYPGPHSRLTPLPSLPHPSFQLTTCFLLYLQMIVVVIINTIIINILVIVIIIIFFFYFYFYFVIYGDERIYLNHSKSIQRAEGSKALTSVANGRYILIVQNDYHSLLFTITVQKYIYPY